MMSSFNPIFTISEYYDRNRSAFYRAIQGVRESGMVMTGWLEYFIEGLTAQLTEVSERGKQVIRRDMLIKKHGLSDRQAKALGQVQEHGSLSIQEFENLFSDVNRRSLQRDLKSMLDMGLFISEGATNKLVYRMKETD
jgi:Fic family protein